MSVSRWWRLAGMSALGFSASYLLHHSNASASQFQQADINPNGVVAVASPYAGGTAHQLLILEQISNARACWRESGSFPTRIEPLLLDYDFTGICDRRTDSNGYSLRVAGEDLNWRYRLQIQRRQNDLVLVAMPVIDRNAPPLEIGRTNGATTGFAKITLNPGWRLTRRSFQGQLVGHTYLTNDRSLASLNAGAIASRPVTLQPLPNQIPTRPVVTNPPITGRPPVTVNPPITIRPPVNVMPPISVRPPISVNPTIPVRPSNPSQAGDVVVPVITIGGNGYPMNDGYHGSPQNPNNSGYPNYSNNSSYPNSSGYPNDPNYLNNPNYPNTPNIPTAPTPLSFNLPELSNTSRPLSLWATYYYVHRAQQVANGEPLRDMSGNPLGVELSRRDWCAAAVEGTVQVMNGDRVLGTYNYAGVSSRGQVNCTAFYPKLGNRTGQVRFTPTRNPFGNGVQGIALVPYRTIAVDRTQIPIGSVIYIPEARGRVITLPSGERVTHDGYFFAGDVGGAIKGRHIDVFLGTTENNPFPFVTSSERGTFTAYVVDDPQIKTALESLHRPNSQTASVPRW